MGEEAKQNSARNNAKCSNCFQFYAIIAIKHGFSCINIRQVPWEVLKTEAFGLLASVFKTSHGTWRMLMHEKPCLIPILLMHIRCISLENLPPNYIENCGPP